MGSEVKNKRILQLGYGAFGPAHAAAWQRLGVQLTIADPNAEARARAKADFPAIACREDWRVALDDADALDILTPTDTHFALAKLALEAGKDVFLEKPMTMHAVEAAQLKKLADDRSLLVQGGFYFRHHPKAVWLHREIGRGGFGTLRYLSGRFAGLKRARTDSGALHNDAVHFIDLFNWLLDERPVRVYAMLQNWFGRRYEDFAFLALSYPSGVRATLETGYAQPGRTADAIVPGAITSKEISLSGSAAVAEIDFARETISLWRGGHQRASGVWQPRFQPSGETLAAAADAVEVLQSQFVEFLQHLLDRSQPTADLWHCGLVPATIIAAAYRAAEADQVIDISY